jgi:hypothetical protein
MTLLAAYYLCLAHHSDAYYRRAVTATFPVPVVMYADDPSSYEPAYATACVKIVPAYQAELDKEEAAKQQKKAANEAAALEALNELAGTLP